MLRQCDTTRYKLDACKACTARAIQSDDAIHVLCLFQRQQGFSNYTRDACNIAVATVERQSLQPDVCNTGISEVGQTQSASQFTATSP